MEDGTPVFLRMAVNEAEDVCSMIIYSTDNGSAWALCEDISPAECLNPRVTGWEGSLLMIVDCEDGQRVCESRDMGTAWTEAIGTLSAVWVNARSGDYQKEACVWMPSSPRPLRKGRSCCALREGTPREAKRHSALPLGHGQQPHVFRWTGCRGGEYELVACQRPAALGWQFASFTTEGQR
ncbi:trans-sialidase [Trypanosoma cruzi]|nr:trans-sialidase [Trypanosoma cruzi]